MNNNYAIGSISGKEMTNSLSKAKVSKGKIGSLIQETCKEYDNGNLEKIAIEVKNTDFIEYRTYHENGNPKSIQYFVDGKEHGYFREYDEDCNLHRSSEFNFGRMATDTIWYKNGRRESHYLFNESGEVVEGVFWDEEGKLLSYENLDE